MVVVGLIALLLLYILLSNVRYPTYTLQNVGLNKQQSFSVLHGDDLLEYNGLGFYKVNVTSGNFSVLRSGVKLPAIDSIYWNGSKGAVMTFRGSYTYTDVEKVLEQQQLKLDKETKIYSWYIDFATGKLSIASKYPVQNGVGYFASSSLFAYVPNTNLYENSQYNQAEYDEDDKITTPVRVFDASTGTDRELRGDIGLAKASTISDCPASTGERSVCVIGTNVKVGTKMQLQAINPDGGLRTLSEIVGGIVATNDPDVILKITPESSNGSDFSDEGSALTGRASIFDVGKNKDTNLGYDLDLQNLSGIHFDDSGNFYVIDNQLFKGGDSGVDEQTAAPYLAGKQRSRGRVGTKNKQLNSIGNTGIIPGFRQSMSHGSGDKSLVTSLTGTKFLISSQKDEPRLSSVDRATLLATLRSCTKKDQSEILTSANQVRLFFVDTPGWQAELLSVSNCLDKKGLGAFLGYNYQIMLTDSVNGRIVND